MKQYLPLFVLILIAILAAAALTHSAQKGFFGWMYYFMGFFFCQFALLKLFNLAKFAEGFQMYDLLAKRSTLYAHLYPFIELALGLSYLAFFALFLTNLITLIVMGIGAVGVIRALKTGLDFRCACMGTILNVPLSTVTLSEDLVMGLMALIMLTTGIGR